MTHLLLLSALVILACVLCNKLSSKLGVPTLLAFILLGMFFGSDGVVKIPFDNYGLAQNICSFALIFIMFYGGFGTNWSQAKPVAGKAAILSSSGPPSPPGRVGAVLLGGSVPSHFGELPAGRGHRLHRRRLGVLHPPLQAAEPGTAPPPCWRWRAAATTPLLTCSPSFFSP